jgi:exopolyphosphatase/guanosine-5'-triphosphate,3'-diphosphate pyrophosphatase
LKLNALKGERAPVLAGGYAIMAAAVAELRSSASIRSAGALRLGVLYDLLGRTIDEDARASTVERFIARYGHRPRAGGSRRHSRRCPLPQATSTPDPALVKLVIGRDCCMKSDVDLACGFHKHSAYVLQHADMPGFSRRSSSSGSLFLDSIAAAVSRRGQRCDRPATRAPVLALRLAVLSTMRERASTCEMRLRSLRGIRRGNLPALLAAHPLTDYLLCKERTACRARTSVAGSFILYAAALPDRSRSRGARTTGHRKPAHPSAPCPERARSR